MGPFVPDLISDQLNLVVALLLGIAFGFVLEQAGFSSSRRLAGVFYGYDFTVLRVFFTAAITAMSGVLILGHFGMLDTDVVITSIIEKRVDKKSAPSLQLKPIKHAVVGTFAVVLGVIFIFMPDHKSGLIEKVSDQAYAAVHPVHKMEVDELAFRIVDHEPNVRIIDIRSLLDFGLLSLPGSYNVQRNDFFGKDWVATFSQRHLEKVIVGDNEADERTAYYLLHELGYENLAILRGGIGAFKMTMLDSNTFVPTGSRWDGDVKEFRVNARTTILKMIADAKNKPVKAIVKRKIQGGC